MNLHAPSVPIFVVSLMFAVLALIGHVVLIPFVTLYGFWVAIIALEKAGAKVLGAVVCGKTIYDLKTKHFGEQEFDLTGELADWTG